jgi:hypothetical protein
VALLVAGIAAACAHGLDGLELVDRLERVFA